MWQYKPSEIILEDWPSAKRQLRISPGVAATVAKRLILMRVPSIRTSARIAMPTTTTCTQYGKTSNSVVTTPRVPVHVRIGLPSHDFSKLVKLLVPCQRDRISLSWRIGLTYLIHGELSLERFGTFHAELTWLLSSAHTSNRRIKDQIFYLTLGAKKHLATLKDEFTTLSVQREFRGGSSSVLLDDTKESACDKLKRTHPGETMGAGYFIQWLINQENKQAESSRQKDEARRQSADYIRQLTEERQRSE